MTHITRLGLLGAVDLHVYNSIDQGYFTMCLTASDLGMKVTSSCQGEGEYYIILYTLLFLFTFLYYFKLWKNRVTMGSNSPVFRRKLPIT